MGPNRANMQKWVIPLKDKKKITVTCTFQKILDESNHKPNMIRVHKGSKCYKYISDLIFAE